jgi:hypothetical protein
MPKLSDLKALLESQIKQPATLILEVVFDNKSANAFDAIQETEDLIDDLKKACPGAAVRGKLVYNGKDYEVK